LQPPRSLLLEPTTIRLEGRYHKDGKTLYSYKYFTDSITADQIRAHVTPNKKCSGCGETINSSNFHIRRSSVDGLNRRCVECTKIQERLTRYGISQSQYTQLCAKQDEKCAICKKDFLAVENIGVGLVIDHDHVTGHVGGILCNRCNLGLVCFDDNPESLEGAIVYVTEHEQRGTCVTETLN
jgi:hypothetical protein